MNKKEFLYKMKIDLSEINCEERQKFLNYYSEMIDDYMEEGLKEEDVIKKIGSPKQISEKIIRENSEESIFKPETINCVLWKILMIISFPLWGCLLLSFLIFIFVIPISACAISLALVINSIVSIVASPFVFYKFGAAVSIMQFGLGVICLGLSIPVWKFTIISWNNVMAIYKNIKKMLLLILKGDRK